MTSSQLLADAHRFRRTESESRIARSQLAGFVRRSSKQGRQALGGLQEPDYRSRRTTSELFMAKQRGSNSLLLRRGTRAGSFPERKAAGTAGLQRAFRPVRPNSALKGPARSVRRNCYGDSSVGAEDLQVFRGEALARLARRGARKALPSLSHDVRRNSSPCGGAQNGRPSAARSHRELS